MRVAKGARSSGCFSCEHPLIDNDFSEVAKCDFVIPNICQKKKKKRENKSDGIESKRKKKGKERARSLGCRS